MGLDSQPIQKLPVSELPQKLTIPNMERILYIKQAFQSGMSIDQIHGYTHIDPFFLYNIKEIIDFEEEIRRAGSESNLDTLDVSQLL